MHVGFVETGAPAAPLEAVHGRYDAMFRSLLAPGGFSYDTFNVFEGPLPAVDACDAFIVTGSASGVYEALDWIAPLVQEGRTAPARIVRVPGRGTD